MIAADETWLTPAELLDLAEQFAAAQTATVVAAVRRLAPAGPVLISGQGEFLLRRALAELRLENHSSLTARLGPELSRVAPAYAVARLAQSADFR